MVGKAKGAPCAIGMPEAIAMQTGPRSPINLEKLIIIRAHPLEDRHPWPWGLGFSSGAIEGVERLGPRSWFHRNPQLLL